MRTANQLINKYIYTHKKNNNKYKKGQITLWFL